MTHSFCAEVAAQSPEGLIGTAYYHATYILVECPEPWTGDIIDSPALPQKLREAIAQVKASLSKIRILLVSQEPKPTFSVLIYQHQSLSNRYQAREFSVQNLEDSAQVLLDYLAGKPSAFERPHHNYQDVLICTHGSHDQCCARFGNPFYIEAKKSPKINKSKVRLWRSSHFGGHRFAPTAITFPDGRYYGWLTVKDLQAVLERSGNLLRTYAESYRGWSLLPPGLQVMEQALIRQVGWSWFEAQVDYQVLAETETKITAQMSRTDETGAVHYYRGTLRPHLVQTQVSCKGKETSAIHKYDLQSLVSFSSKFVLATG
jgi:hypothetical protein